MSKPEIRPSTDPTKTCFVLGNVTFEVDSKYIVAKGVGYGTYGILCVAQHAETEDKVVIEKVEGMFCDLEEARILIKELTLMNELSHVNIVSIKDVLKPTSKDDFQDFYIVYEPMSQDLREKARSARLSLRHARYFCYQLLCALKYIHSAGIVHADVRPKHLLVDDSANLKLFNFTSASANGEGDAAHIVSRIDQPFWYCAPELLSSGKVTTAADVWSAGCIVAELVAKRALFKGKTAADVLQSIQQPVVVTPTEAEDGSTVDSTQACTFTELVLSKCRDTHNECPDLALDLLDKLLKVDPAARISASEALEHKWFADLHEVEAEVAAAHAVVVPAPAEMSSEADIRSMLFALSQRYNPAS